MVDPYRALGVQQVKPAHAAGPARVEEACSVPCVASLESYSALFGSSLKWPWS